MIKSVKSRSIGSVPARRASVWSTVPADRVVCPTVWRNDSARTRTCSSSSTKRIVAKTVPPSSLELDALKWRLYWGGTRSASINLDRLGWKNARQSVAGVAARYHSRWPLLKLGPRLGPSPRLFSPTNCQRTDLIAGSESSQQRDRCCQVTAVPPECRNGGTPELGIVRQSANYSISR